MLFYNIWNIKRLDTYSIKRFTRLGLVDISFIK